MTKLLFTGALVCTVALAAHPNLEAGERRLKRVWVSEGSAASGNVGDVFNSQGNVEFIFCRVTSADTGASTGDVWRLGACYAKDEKGQTAQCMTDEPGMIATMLGINGDSTISFYVRDDGWWCSNLAVTNGSLAAPKRQTTPEDAAPLDTTGIDTDELQQ